MSERINSISPIDGRYFDKVQVLSNFFSEKALIKYRIRIEIEYFISLSALKIKEFNSWNKQNNIILRKLYQDFSDEDALDIKKIEKITNHDVKACEYFLKKKFKLLGFEKYSEFIHFGLTSQDINNTAIPLLIKDYLEFNSKDDNNLGYFAQIVVLINKIEEKSKKMNSKSMKKGCGKNIDFSMCFFIDFSRFSTSKSIDFCMIFECFWASNSKTRFCKN